MIAFPEHARPTVSVLIVTYGGWEWTERCLRDLRSHTGLPYEVVIVDNASPDETPARLRHEVAGADVVLNEDNEGFGPAANAAARRSRGDFLVFLNPDALVRPGWLPPLVETILDDPRIGIVAPRLLNLDGTVQEVGSIVWADGSTESVGGGADPDDPVHRFRRTTDYASAACAVVRRDTFLAVGGFNPHYLPAYCEDVDLALTLRARGLRTVVDPRSEVVHVRFGTSGAEAAARLIRRNRRLLVRRWGGTLAGRPPPYRPDRPHRMWAGRDRESVERFLVVASAPSPLLLRALAAGYPAARITAVFTGSGPAPAGLLDEGFEVVPAPLDLRDWLRDRRFHYSAVVVAGEWPSGLRSGLRESQPQAEVLDGGADPEPSRVLEWLDRSGIPAEPSEVA